MQEQSEFDVVIVGAGFAGMYMLHRVRGLGLTARVFEAGDGVGGTWYWNRYPGARCDVESMQYSYQFSEELQQEWEWSERYATQPEILKYANHVADRFGLRTDMQFETRVQSAIYDDAAVRWAITTERLADGQMHEVRAQFLIMATGCLSSANVPNFPGRDTFAGDTYHTGQWPHAGVDFTGKRVGVIGTGSSAIQSIPIIAQQAERLTVFQRTASYSVPAANRPLDEDDTRAIKADYAAFRAVNSQSPTAIGSQLPVSEMPTLAVDPEERERIYETRWKEGGLPFLGAFFDLLIDKQANDTAAEFVRNKIHGIVEDPAVADLLSPKTVVGCKRLCVDTGYFATYNRPNVELVDVSEHAIDAITPRGIVVGDREFELDCIVFATGFDAMTGALAKIDIRGVDGHLLRDAWSAGPRTYLGLGTVGFPNFFTISGPGSPSVLTNMIVSIEQHVNWITDCIEYLRDNGFARIEPTLESQDAWVDFVNMVADFTLFPTCNSWYLGANVPGKPRVFMPLLGFPTYVEKCDDVAAKGYEGFALAGAPGD
jgi:cation diffusion facilitator CzcD-associated flavoprotein CzcO